MAHGYSITKLPKTFGKMYYNENMEHINRTTLRIAKALLKEAGFNGISKVRLAKMIYFTHKELCRKRLLVSTDIRYIRMPLGPVPQGYGELVYDPAIQVREEKTRSTLAYNSRVFYLKEGAVVDADDFGLAVKEVFAKLNTFLTSALVEKSHKDFSWKNHRNGETFCVSNKDLEAAFSRLKKPKVSDSQKLQSLLLEGMLEDVVEESTNLEYPHHGESTVKI